MLSRQRASTAEVEQVLDNLLSNADQAMVNAFTTGFRVAQTKLAITRVVPEAVAAVALESAQIVALAILVREQLDPATFDALYRPFATVLPGPNYQPPASVDRQIAAFLARLPNLSGPTEAEAAAVARVLSEPPKPVAPSAAGAKSASSKTMNGALPPSSNETRLSCALAPAIKRLPTSVDPVNAILRTAGWSRKTWPIMPLFFPVTTLKTPAGNPAVS